MFQCSMRVMGRWARERMPERQQPDQRDRAQPVCE